MNHKKYIAILLLAGIIVVGLIFLWRGAGTFYHGHRLSWWVEQYGNFENARERRAEAKEALSAIGTNAVPYLMNLIGNVDAKPSSELNPVDQENFRERTWHQAWCAATAFSALGANATSCIPELKARAANPANGNVCLVAEGALVQMGPDGFAAALDVIAMPELPQRGLLMQSGGLAEHMRPIDAMTIVGHGDPNFRINSIRAAPVLLKSLGDDDIIVRNHALTMLSYSDPGVMVPALTNFLAGSPPPAVRSVATQALAMHGTNALDAVPFLLSMYSNSNQEISVEASNALMQIAPETLAKVHP